MRNHNLDLEVPYRYGSETRRYLPDFIALVDDGTDGDLLHLVVEITLGRWALAELPEIYQIDADFRAKVESEFDAMTVRGAGASPRGFPP